MKGRAGAGKSTLLTFVSLWKIEMIIMRGHAGVGKSTILTLLFDFFSFCFTYFFFIA